MRDIAEDYIREHRAYAKSEMRSFAMEPSLADAVARAASCELADGKRHPHQYRIPRTALAKCRTRLLGVGAELAGAVSFDELHGAVHAAIGDVRGIGPLTIYDIAHRIGAFLGLHPTRVYLHRGTIEGARALGLAPGLRTLEMRQLPRELQRLKAAEVEDCLCIYKRDLRRLRAAK